MRGLDFTVAPWNWRFSQERRADIDAFWKTVRGANPALWNGRVLMLHALKFEDTQGSGAFFETDFSDFSAWESVGCAGRRRLELLWHGRSAHG